MNPSGSASSRPVYCRIIGHCSTRLWGLDSHQRLGRQLANIGAVTMIADDRDLPSAASVLILRADQLYDQRTLNDLVAMPGTALRAYDSPEAQLVAAHVDAARVPQLLTAMTRGAAANGLTEIEIRSPETLSSSYVQKLLKSDPPLVLSITDDNRPLLERHLFDGSYKGVTDFVTKWLWPAPARAVVRLCVTFGIRPNAVTMLSLVLVVLALGLFLAGWFGTGLVLAWIMTFLDTVDGKLARVTIDSSSFGHALDKGIDLISPPLWYIAWGVGAANLTDWLDPPRWLIAASLVILAGYILGRLLEGAFDFFLGKFPIYSWRPLDSYVRLVIARRNPNLLWLTGFWLVGKPVDGMVAVAVWTAVSTVFLFGRLLFAAYCRATQGTLHSWLRDADHDGSAPSLAVRTFAGRAPQLQRVLEGR